MIFKQFADSVEHQFNKMQEDNLFVVNISKDELRDAYIAAFPTGTNGIYRERPIHDCN